jgi:homoserine dehydrogenase
VTTATAAVAGHVDPVASPPRTLRLALLGFGSVGSAVARLAHDSPLHPARVTAALVRDVRRDRGPASQGIALASDASSVLASRPDVVIEALGGREPARSLVIDALARGVPVVSANKSLLAWHGDEVLAAAEAARTPLRYEAAVMAGVPFLCAFADRPFAASVHGFTAIVNGTCNFILSAMSGGRATRQQALAEAQRRGYAEPDPSSDVSGRDAAEKLCVLLRHFGGWSTTPNDLDVEGIERIDAEDLEQAREFGGVIRPLVSAAWECERPWAIAAPAFIPRTHPLAAVQGVDSGIVIRTRYHGVLTFGGPGAGPEVTAATLLDDAVTAARPGSSFACAASRRPSWDAPATSWFVRVGAARLPDERDTADLLGSHGVWLKRTSPRDTRRGGERQWALVHADTKPRIESALAALGRAACCDTLAIRAMEA